MRPQPGNALQEGREKKGDSDTDLRARLVFCFCCCFCSRFWPVGGSGSGPWGGLDLARGGIWIWPVGGSWEQTWGLRPGGSRR